MIPKKIVQTYRSWDSRPPAMIDAMMSVQQKNPDFEYQFFSDDDCRNFLMEHYGKPFVDIFDRIIPGAYKADFWRYAYLLKFGGVYIDGEMQAMRGLTGSIDLSNDLVVPKDREQFGLYQAFVCVRPKHPVLKNALNLCIENFNTHAQGVNDLDRTGPLVFGRALNQYLGRDQTELIQTGQITREIRVLAYDHAESDHPYHLYDQHGNLMFLTSSEDYLKQRDSKTNYSSTKKWIRKSHRSTQAKRNDTLIALAVFAGAVIAVLGAVGLYWSVLGMLLVSAVVGTAVLVDSLVYGASRKSSREVDDVSQEVVELPIVYKDRVDGVILPSDLPDAEKLEYIWNKVEARADRTMIIPSPVLRDRQVSWDSRKYGHERGIVIAAGGYDYLTNAYVLVRQLREHGCTLPVEMFHLRGEIPSKGIKELFAGIGVDCREIQADLYGYTPKNKFSIKVIAIFLSSFKECMYLDADNNVLRDPTYLFDHPAYTETGALFWPDYWPLDTKAECYKNMHPKPKVSDLNAYAQESGQIVMDLTKHSQHVWSVFLCLENDLMEMFPEPCNHGDKDIFHTSFDAAQVPYQFVQHRAASIGDGQGESYQGVGMGQYDPDGKLLFIHQNMINWTDRLTAYTQEWKLCKSFNRTAGGQVLPYSWRPVPENLVDTAEITYRTEEFGHDVVQELRANEAYKSAYRKQINKSLRAERRHLAGQ